MKNRIVCWVMCLVMLVGCLCGCSEAEKVNKNISKQANYFETERHITVYNARTDKVILEAEGLMSITNNSSNELVCTIKTGPNTYKKNYIKRPHIRVLSECEALIFVKSKEKLL